MSPAPPVHCAVNVAFTHYDARKAEVSEAAEGRARQGAEKGNCPMIVPRIAKRTDSRAG